MTLNEIKKWAKSFGYSIIKEKETTTDPVQYFWAKNDDVNATGVATSVSKVATAIFNHMTDNKWVDHQTDYKLNQTYNINTIE